MSEIEAFEFAGANVRVVVVDGEPWFVAADVSRILGYRDSANLTRRLDEDDRGTRSVSTPGGYQMVTVISEPGLYVAVLGSQVKRAREFKQWITHDVLPAIRRTGTYSATPALSEDQIVAQALAITSRRVQALEEKVAEDAPKVEYVERYVAKDDDLITVDNFASQFGTAGPKVRAAMLARGVAVKKKVGSRWSTGEQCMKEEHEWRPRQGVASSAWFELRPQHNAPRLHNGQVRQTMYVKQFYAFNLAAQLGLVDGTLEWIES